MTSIGPFIGWAMIIGLFGWAGFLAWAEYRMHHPKDKK